MNLCGPKVKKIRTRLEWSQHDLAVRCQILGWDVSRDIIARIELQKRWVGDFELLYLAKALKVDVKSLLF